MAAPLLRNLGAACGGLLHDRESVGNTVATVPQRSLGRCRMTRGGEIAGPGAGVCGQGLQTRRSQRDQAAGDSIEVAIRQSCPGMCCCAADAPLRSGICRRR